MRPSPVIALLLLATLFGVQPTAAQELPAQATLVMEPVEVQLPDGSSRMAERGMLWVPMVRSNPSSKRIGIDVWRFKTTSTETPAAPPIFLLHGGPGWPGMEPNSIQWSGSLEWATGVSDCIVVGQRGIGSSTDTSCDLPHPAGMSVPTDDSSIEEQAAYIRKRCTQCREHWEAQGYDLSGLNVIEAAADVADVSRLLGYPKISLWGVSFGSHWSMTVMRYHPELVARALLSGMEGPDQTYDRPSGVLEAISLMAQAAEASPRLAEHIPDGGLIEAFGALIDGVEEEPFEVEVRNPRTGREEPVTIDGEALRSVALGMRARVSSRGGMRAWPAMLITLIHGDFEPLARHILRNQGPPGLPTASFFMLDCGSGISPARHAEYRQDPAMRIVGNLSEFYETACPMWDADLGAAFRSDFVSEIPTLVVHGIWDVSTPFSNALECIPFFKNLNFIPVDGGSHGALGEALRFDPSFHEAVMGFLRAGETAELPTSISLPEVQWVIPTD